MLNKRFPILLLLCSILSYCNLYGQNNTLVSGQFSGTANSSYIYLTRLFGNKTEVIDSVKHKSGKFQFKKTANFQRGFYRLSASTTGTAVMLILGEPNLVVNGDLSANGKFTIEESKENAVYQSYQELNASQNQQSNALQKQAEQIQKQGLSEEEFKTLVTPIQLKYDSLLAKYTASNTLLIEQNKGLFITKVISMFSNIDNATASSFFQSVDLSDPEVCRGDMLPSKINIYFQRFVTPDINNWKQNASALLMQFDAASDNKQVLYLSLIDMFSPYDPDYTKTLTVQYAKEYPQSTFAKQALANAPRGSLSIGDEAIDLSLTSPDGKVISLKSLRGKYVLLDFWASWCGPCRQENPNVVKAYNEYKDKGFTVYSVSLDDNAEKWKGAIAKDGLVWPNHVSDLKGWKSKAAELYNIKGIPMTFLLDKEGVIIATNLRGYDLLLKLKDLLKE